MTPDDLAAIQTRSDEACALLDAMETQHMERIAAVIRDALDATRTERDDARAEVNALRAEMSSMNAHLTKTQAEVERLRLDRDLWKSEASEQTRLRGEVERLRDENTRLINESEAWLLGHDAARVTFTEQFEHVHAEKRQLTAIVVEQRNRLARLTESIQNMPFIDNGGGTYDDGWNQAWAQAREIVAQAVTP